MTPKIALVIPGFQSDRQDWCIPVFTNLARELSRSAELHVFALRYPHRTDHYDVGLVHVHALGGGAFCGRRLPAISLLNLWRNFHSEIEAEQRRGRFSVVMGIWATEAGWLATRAARRLGLPSLVHLAGGELTHIPHIGYGNYKRGLAGRLVDDTLARANALTVPSGPMHRALVRTGPPVASKIFYWAPGVDVEMFVPGPRRSSQAKTFSFVSVGSLVPVKGQELLVRALALVRAEMPERDVRLRIVGAGPLDLALGRLVTHLGLWGYVNLGAEVAHDALPAIYRESDAVLLGSWHEAQCMAVLEAMACGLPWIGPPVGVLPDVSAFGTDASSGLVFHDRNPRSVADKMIRLALLDAGERVEWGRRARAVVLEHYALAQQSARLLSLLEGLTERDGVAYHVKASL